ncbi:hypothetical protein QZH41_016142 [Actinostola sp. cb2023]|nr:hypothetical protein QZH41_016142 [Actinostola sp. cb2023]
MYSKEWDVYKNMSTGEAIQLKLEMDPESTPVAQKPRTVPYHLQQPLKQWLEEGVETEIFEKVPPGEAITWCSPLVVQPKPKFAETNKELESHMISRASIDLRIPNKSMKRRKLQTTTAPLWSQIITRRLRRSDVQSIWRHSTLPNQTVYWVETTKKNREKFWKKYYKELNISASRSTKRNANLRKTKLNYLDTSSPRLRASPDKFRAIKERGTPKGKEGVRSFLGMLGYLDNFIEDYASIAAPYYTDYREEKSNISGERMRKKHSRRYKTAYRTTRQLHILTQTNKSSYERKQALTKVYRQLYFRRQTEAYSHFTSRTMTDAEKRYSQTEKDALAIKWAKYRLRVYLLGAPRFTIITAHKPLLP